LAGFVGWLLAQSVLQSTWWANLSQMFGGL